MDCSSGPLLVKTDIVKTGHELLVFISHYSAKSLIKFQSYLIFFPAGGQLSCSGTFCTAH